MSVPSPGDIKLTAVKYDTDKPKLSLLSTKAIMEIAKVATFGAKKYEAHNWRRGFKWSRLLDASLRHISAFQLGESIDPESGMQHLAHAAWGLMALIEYEIDNVGENDLYKHPPKN